MTVARKLTRTVRRGLSWLHARIDHVYDEYGPEIQISTGACMIVISAILVVIGLQVADQAGLAKESCERSREFGPYIARDYDRRDVLPEPVQDSYEATIPRRCG